MEPLHPWPSQSSTQSNMKFDYNKKQIQQIYHQVLQGWLPPRIIVQQRNLRPSKGTSCGAKNFIYDKIKQTGMLLPPFCYRNALDVDVDGWGEWLLCGRVGSLERGEAIKFIVVRYIGMQTAARRRPALVVPIYETNTIHYLCNHTCFAGGGAWRV